MIYASVCIRSLAQSHNSSPYKAQGGQFVSGGAQWQGKAAGERCAYSVLQASPFNKHYPPCRGRSFTLLLSFLVLVSWLCNCLSCSNTAWIRDFLCIHFSSFPGGKRAKGPIANPCPGTCPTPDREKGNKREKKGRQIRWGSEWEGGS